MSAIEFIPQPPSLKYLLESFLKENEALFLAHASSAALPDSFTGIHQMRVAAKRLRSLFKLMDWLAPDRFKSKLELRELRKYFKAAGMVRDIQMRQLLLEGYCNKLGLDFDRYSALLRADRLAAQKDLKKRMRCFSPKIMEAPATRLLTLLHTMEEGELVEGTHHLLENMQEQMQLLFPPTYDPERFHKIRIVLKESLYVHGLVCMVDADAGLGTEGVEALKKAAETAGEWHDLEVFLATLDRIALESPQVFPQNAHFLSLRNLVEEDMRHDLRRYKRQLKKLLGKKEQ
jgi:CHAD domain-containing protein